MPSANAEATIKETAQNIHKPGGWESYKKKTEEAAQKLGELVDNN